MAVIRKRQRRHVTPEEKVQRGNRLRYLRKILRYSAKIFGEKCQTKDSTLKSWEQGRHTGLTTDGALKVVEACKKEGVINCTLEWLLYGQGVEPELRIGMVSNVTANTITQELSVFHQLHANAIDTIVQDDSMQPCFAKGDHVAGIRYFENYINKLIGLNCIVQLVTGETLVRKLLKGEKEGFYTLTSINQSTEYPNIKNIELFSAAHIIWLRKPELMD